MQQRPRVVPFPGNSPRRRPRRWLRFFLLSGGVLLVLGAITAYAALWAVRQYSTTPRGLIMRVAERAHLNNAWVRRLIYPSARYTDHVLDGQLKTSRPRLLLPELAAWDGKGAAPGLAERESLRKLMSPNERKVCEGKSMLALTACWLSTGDHVIGLEAIEALARFTPSFPNITGSDTNAWELAVAYDLLSKHPALDQATRELVEARLHKVLQAYFLMLDEDSASLWHGRTSLAAEAWLCALVLEPGGALHDELLRRAQGHFLASMQAVALTEAWPEGYNYWINSRGFVVALAGLAYLNALTDSRLGGEIRRVLKRVGLWHVYATRPDHRIEGFGDEGPRVDLKDETRRVIDALAAATGSSELATYSYYVHKRHRRESYYGAYVWSLPLLNDPTVAPLPGVTQGELQGLEAWLPRAELFGRDATNALYLRSDWSADATFVSFRASASFTHHGHYDAGHFTIFKGAPLAVNSSSYESMPAPNRLNYSIRSIAKNTLLVMRPNELVRPNDFFTDNVADGGQRLSLPTGSSINSVNDWRANLDQGLHLEAAHLLAYDFADGEYTYIATDLTPAYNNPRHDDGGKGGKVTRVRRELLYLFGEDVVLLHDEVAARDPGFRKKWLLHTVARPQLDTATVLRGSADDGILQAAGNFALVQNGRGYLALHALFPRQALLRLVGGPEHRFYVERDGDDTSLDGTNFAEGASDKAWFDQAFWRIELMPAQANSVDHFVTALLPSLDRPRTDRVNAVTTSGEASWAAATEKTVVLFTGLEHGGSTSFELPGAQARLLIFGLAPRARLRLTVNGLAQELEATNQGTARIDLGAAAAAAIKLLVL
jgi:hypothetical protein